MELPRDPTPAPAPSSAPARTVMWVRMNNGGWWPTTAISVSQTQPEDPAGDFLQSAPRLGRVSIVGLGTEIAVDTGDRDSVRHLAVGSSSYLDLCSSQAVPDHLKEKFAQSILVLHSLFPFDNAASAAGGPCPGAGVECAPLSPCAPGITRRRTDVLGWDDYFMSVAFLSSLRSKDPSTQVGACIVNEDLRIVGIGYNGKHIKLTCICSDFFLLVVLCSTCDGYLTCVCVRNIIRLPPWLQRRPSSVGKRGRGPFGHQIPGVMK
jgi:hypothetical protein